MSLTKVKGAVWDATDNNLTTSIVDFGAVGDGVTDDTAAIQAAIDGSAGKRLLFPSGIYLVSDEIIVSTPLTLVGSTPHATANNTVFGGSWLKLADTSGLTATQGVLRLTHAGPTEANYRRFINVFNLGINGNRDNNTNGNGILMECRNVLLDSVHVIQCGTNGILSQDNAAGYGGSNSCVIRDAWVGYNDLNGLNMQRTSTSGDNRVIGGHYHWNDQIGVEINQPNTEIIGVSSWWNRDGFAIDGTQGSMVSMTGCHGYDNARSGVYLRSDIDYVSITGGAMNANNNATRATSLSLTVADAEKAGIYGGGATTNVLIDGVNFGFLSNSSGQKWGVNALNASASLRFGAVDCAGATANLIEINASAAHYWHGLYAETPLIRHPGFELVSDINASSEDIYNVKTFGHDSWEELTSITSTTISPSKTCVVLDVSGGGTINDIAVTNLPAGIPRIIIRNANATAVTLAYNSSKLRLLGKTNLSLTTNSAVEFVYVSGTIWQQVGGLV